MRPINANKTKSISSTTEDIRNCITVGGKESDAKICFNYIGVIRENVVIRAVFTQRSLSDLTLDQSKVRSDKVCVNTLNRIGKPDRKTGKKTAW